MNRGDLERLSRDELIELVLRLQRPDKTSRNSSKPPSTDRKEQRKNARPGGAKPGHQGHARALSENPDAFEDHAPTHCQRCGLAFAEDAERELIGEYDDIELPPVRPFVTRHRRYAMRCSCCAEPTRGAPPAVAQATPLMVSLSNHRTAHPRAGGLSEDDAIVLLSAALGGVRRSVRAHDQRRRADEHVR